MGPIFQEDITVLIVYVPNNRNSKYIKGKSMDLQREIDESTAIVREMSIPLYQKWTNTTNPLEHSISPCSSKPDI